MVGSNGVTRRVANRTDDFIEVPVSAPGSWSASPQCIIELEERQGAKLTVRLAQVETTTALALAQGLWSRRR